MTIWSSSGESGGQASGSDPVAELEAKKACRMFCTPWQDRGQSILGGEWAQRTERVRESEVEKTWYSWR